MDSCLLHTRMALVSHEYGVGIGYRFHTGSGKWRGWVTRRVTRWDLFRIVLGQDLPKLGKEEESPDGLVTAPTKEEGFWTLNNEVVKSRHQRLSRELAVLQRGELRI